MGRVLFWKFWFSYKRTGYNLYTYQIRDLVSASQTCCKGICDNGNSTAKAFPNPGSKCQCSLIMVKLVRRSHYDIFLQFRSNHLQYRIRPGNFWNDIVSLVHFIHSKDWHNILLSERVFPIHYELIIGNLRKLSWRNEDVLCPAFHGRILQLCG